MENGTEREVVMNNTASHRGGRNFLHDHMYTYTYMWWKHRVRAGQGGTIILGLSMDPVLEWRAHGLKVRH